MDLARFDIDGDAPPPEGPFVAAVPGEHAVCHTLDLPPRVAGRARRAIAERQLGDRLAIDPAATACHPVGPATEGWATMVVADATRATQWRAALARDGARCRALLPDYFLLPWSAGTWTVRRADRPGTGPWMVARLSADFGFAAPWDMGYDILRLSGPPPPRIVVHGTDTLPERFGDFGATVDLHAGDPPPSDPGKSGYPVDLRNDRAAAVRRMADGLRSWRAAAALLLIGIVGLTVAALSERNQARAALTKTTTAVDAFVRETFIPTGPILDARAQVARIVAAASAPQEDSGATAPLDLVRRAVTVLATDDADVQTIVVAPGATGGVRLTLETDSFATLDTLVLALRDAGLAVTVSQSSIGDGGRTLATLRLEAG